MNQELLKSAIITNAHINAGLLELFDAVRTASKIVEKRQSLLERIVADMIEFSGGNEAKAKALRRVGDYAETTRSRDSQYTLLLDQLQAGMASYNAALKALLVEE